MQQPANQQIELETAVAESSANDSASKPATGNRKGPGYSTHAQPLSCDSPGMRSAYSGSDDDSYDSDNDFGGFGNQSDGAFGGSGNPSGSNGYDNDNSSGGSGFGSDDNSGSSGFDLSDDLGGYDSGIEVDFDSGFDSDFGTDSGSDFGGGFDDYDTSTWD